LKVIPYSYSCMLRATHQSCIILISGEVK